MKIAFIGLPCCGKTTLAKKVSQYLAGSYVPEMARFYIKNIGRPLESGDQYIIAKFQSDLEKELELSEGITVCDVPVYTSAIYDYVYNKGKDVDKILELSNQHNYDIIFNIVDSPEYKEDGIRYHTKEDLIKLEQLIKKYNKGQKIVNIFGIDKTDRFEKILEALLK